MDPTTNPAADPILDIIPQGYRGFALACIVLTPILGRCWHALTTNGGLKGVWNALIFGTNTPKVLVACLAVLSLSSCNLSEADKATLRANAINDGDAAILGYLQGGKAGAIASLTAQEIANIKARQTAAKNPVVGQFEIKSQNLRFNI